MTNVLGLKAQDFRLDSHSQQDLPFGTFDLGLSFSWCVCGTICACRAEGDIVMLIPRTIDQGLKTQDFRCGRC